MKSPNPIMRLALIVTIVVVAFLGYRFFFATPVEVSEEGLVGLAPAGISTNDQASSDEFLTLLSSLQAIDLSDLPRVLSLLSGLEDFSTELESQIPGRANPFAPIGIGGAPAVETIVATTTATSSTSATSTSN